MKNLKRMGRRIQMQAQWLWPLALACSTSLLLFSRCTSPLSLTKAMSNPDAIRMEIISRIDDPSSFPTSPINSPRLVWISLDGLTTSLLDGFIARKRATGDPLHPFGLAYLREKLPASQQVQVEDATITATSHTSTITCSSPLYHGIIGNSVWNGEKSDSGFSLPYAAETFIHALRKEGLKVASVGYPGFDQKSENRFADFSMAYNANRNSSQFLEIAAGLNQVVQIADDTGRSETTFPIRIKSNADVSRVDVLTTDGELIGNVGPDAWSDLLLHGSDATRIVSMRVFENTLYIAPTSQNQVFPAPVRHELDAKGHIFPSGKDFDVQNRFGDMAFLLTMEHRLHYFTHVAHQFLETPELDAAFLYFEDLDVLGHSFSGYDSKVSVVDTHLSRFDRYLGTLLSRLGKQTNLVVVGDHGMTAVNMMLNPVELIPEHLRSKVVIKASGGTLWVYGPTKDSLLSSAPTHEMWFEDLTEALSEATLPGDSSRRIITSLDVIDATRRQQVNAAPNLPLPWIQATVATDIGLRVSVEPGLLSALRAGIQIPDALLAKAVKTPDGKLPEPVPPGQHGHLSTDPKMLTHLFARGPEVEKVFIGKNRTRSHLMNTRIVPKIAQALSWPAPDACR